MSVRPIGEIVAPIIAAAISAAEEFSGLQFELSICADDAERKRTIMAWWERDFITADDAGLLISANLLEDA